MRTESSKLSAVSALSLRSPLGWCPRGGDLKRLLHPFQAVLSRGPLPNVIVGSPTPRRRVPSKRDGCQRGIFNLEGTDDSVRSRASGQRHPSDIQSQWQNRFSAAWPAHSRSNQRHAGCDKAIVAGLGLPPHLHHLSPPALQHLKIQDYADETGLRRFRRLFIDVDVKKLESSLLRSSLLT